MKIALPDDNGNVNQHFGRSKVFKVIELENGAIKSQKNVSAENLQHNHEGLAGLMRNERVDVVIVGGIGARALEPLQQAGLEVITGANGKIEEVVSSYARGELVSNSSACCSHHGEDHHGQGCHHH